MLFLTVSGNLPCTTCPKLYHIIQGRILDIDGKAMEGVNISVIYYHRNFRYEAELNDYLCFTNKEGRFKCRFIFKTGNNIMIGNKYITKDCSEKPSCADLIIRKMKYQEETIHIDDLKKEFEIEKLKENEGAASIVDVGTIEIKKEQ